MGCFQVSIEKNKGTTTGWFDSDCGAICPQHCIGNWNVWVEGSWKKDSTLAVTKSGE